METKSIRMYHFAALLNFWGMNIFFLLHIALNTCKQGVKAEQTESHAEVAFRDSSETLERVPRRTASKYPKVLFTPDM